MFTVKQKRFRYAVAGYPEEVQYRICVLKFPRFKSTLEHLPSRENILQFSNKTASP